MHEVSLLRMAGDKVGGGGEEVTADGEDLTEVAAQQRSAAAFLQ